jgi:hypothetical protein
VVSRFDEPLIGLRLFGDTLSPSLIDVDSLTPRRRGFAERGACVNCRTPRLHLTAKREGKGGRSRPFLYYLSRHRGNSHGRTTRRSLNGRRSSTWSSVVVIVAAVVVFALVYWFLR